MPREDGLESLSLAETRSSKKTILETGGGVSCREIVYHILEKWHKSWNGCHCHIIYLSLVTVQPLPVRVHKLCFMWGSVRLCLSLSWPARSCCSLFCCYNSCLMTRWLHQHCLGFVQLSGIWATQYERHGHSESSKWAARWWEDKSLCQMGRGWGSWDSGRADIRKFTSLNYTLFEYNH